MIWRGLRPRARARTLRRARGEARGPVIRRQEGRPRGRRRRAAPLLHAAPHGPQPVHRCAARGRRGGGVERPLGGAARGQGAAASCPRQECQSSRGCMRRRRPKARRAAARLTPPHRHAAACARVSASHPLASHRPRACPSAAPHRSPWRGPGFFYARIDSEKLCVCSWFIIF